MIGSEYLPAVARRLFNCRDLEEFRPFDFLTFFEFGTTTQTEFDVMLSKWRKTEEWT